MQEEHSEAAARGRYGYVSAYDPKRHMARIRFPDKDNMVSAWLPVAVPNSKKNKDECHLDIDEHVYCNMLGNGLEAGVVLCSIWDDRNQPPRGDPDVRQITFDDGTEIFYDRKNHVLTANVIPNGTVHVSVPNGLVQHDVPGGNDVTSVPGGLLLENVPGGEICMGADAIKLQSSGCSGRFDHTGCREIYAKKLSATRAGEDIEIGTPGTEERETFRQDPETQQITRETATQDIPRTPRITIEAQEFFRIHSYGRAMIHAEGPVTVTAPDIVLRGRVWANHVHPLSEYAGEG